MKFKAMIKDETLLDLLKTKPEQGLALALQEYGALVKRVIITIMPQIDNRDLEECISDVYLRFYQSYDRFDNGSGSSVKAYLCGIARHVAIDRARRLKKIEFLPLTAQEIGLEPDLVQGLTRLELAQTVREAVLNLEHPDREIFVLWYFFNQKVAEIANTLSLDEKAVENRLYRGKKRLKSELLRKGVVCDA